MQAGSRAHLTALLFLAGAYEQREGAPAEGHQKPGEPRGGRLKADVSRTGEDVTFLPRVF